MQHFKLWREAKARHPTESKHERLRTRNPWPIRDVLLFSVLPVLLGLATLAPRAAMADMSACNVETLRSIAPQGVTIHDVSNVYELDHLPKTSNGVAYVPAGTLGKGSPEFCLVTGSFVTDAATDKTAHFAAGLPARQAWNGKFMFQGCGYNCGMISPPAIAELKKGYPVWSTDDGHTAKPGPGPRLPIATDATWAISAPGQSHTDAVTDFMYRAVHTLTQMGKAFTLKFYAASKLDRAYFIGCSDGGREGMVELSNFPTDYDGIIAGAPYFDMSNEMYTTLVGIQAQLRNAGAALSPELYKVLGRAVMSRCDASDGITDGLIQNPANCPLDPQKDLPKCGRGGDHAQCFTQDQIDSLSVIFSAITSPAGKVVYPGFSFSDPQYDMAYWLGFAAPADNLTGPQPWSDHPGEQPIGWYWSSGALTEIIYDGAPGFSPLTTPGITFRSEKVGQTVGLHAVIPASTVALITRKTYAGTGSRPEAAGAYLRQGRKLIMYHGYSDGLITPYRTIQYYRTLAALHGGVARLRENAELFMVPDMRHCGRGPGPNAFGQHGSYADQPTDAQRDIVTALERWVEHGERPTHLIATKYADDDESKSVERTMPLCPYPAKAKYRGKGDVKDAKNWSCPARDASLEKIGPAGVRVGVQAPLK